ncbi:MAG TPA: hypothetical protein VKB52_06495, partial [Rhodanobacteraceae bacterium]|nr:hypothetical protein [Rhodanobacteraceae bacterium]
LAWFVDHRTRSFMQSEMDEDAVDLQADIMKSLRIKMRREGGVDPFEMAKSLCPDMSANMRDRLPDEPVDCGDGTTLGGAMRGPDGKPMSQDQMAAAMKAGNLPIDEGMLRKMMEQSLAQMPPEQRAQVEKMMANGAMPMPGMPNAHASKPAAPPRIDRDGGTIDVDGIACTRREHLRGEEMLREDCYATATTLRLGEAETKRLGRFSKSIQTWAASLVPEGMQQPPDDRVLVRRVCYAAGKESGRATLAIENAAISPARFEVPAGYKPMDLGFGAHGREDQPPGSLNAR